MLLPRQSEILTPEIGLYKSMSENVPLYTYPYIADAYFGGLFPKAILLSVTLLSLLSLALLLSLPLLPRFSSLFLSLSLSLGCARVFYVTLSHGAYCAVVQ